MSRYALLMIDIYIYNRIASDESIPLLSYLYVYITSIIFYKKNKTMRMIFLYLDFNVFKKRHMNGFFVYFSSSVICSCYYCCFSNPNFLLLLFLAVIKKECTLKNSSRKEKRKRKEEIPIHIIFNFFFFFVC